MEPPPLRSQEPPPRGSFRGGSHSSAPTTEEVQRMLDENAQLIQVIVAKQNEGKVRALASNFGPGCPELKLG